MEDGKGETRKEKMKLEDAKDTKRYLAGKEEVLSEKQKEPPTSPPLSLSPRACPLPSAHHSELEGTMFIVNSLSFLYIE